MTRRLALFVCAFLLAAASASAQDHAWIDVDAAQFTPRQKIQTFTYSFRQSQETGAVAVAYPELDKNADVDVSGGVQLWRGLGFAVHFDAQNYTETVGIAIAIPSPYFFGATALDARPSGNDLERKERALDLGAAYTIPAGKVHVRVFGGPTIFWVKNEMIDIVRYDQVASRLIPINSVAIRTYTTQEITGTSVGFHIGTDVSYFFTRVVGVGGGIRANRGKVTVTDPLSNTSGDLDVGHFAYGGGLRLKF